MKLDHHSYRVGASLTAQKVPFPRKAGPDPPRDELSQVLEPDFRVNRAEWDHLEETAEGPYAPSFLPLVRELPPWVRDFPFYFSHDELVFSHCPGYPFSREGLPSVSCRDGGFLIDDLWFSTASAAAAHLAKVLIDQHDFLFSGNVDHKAYVWLRERLAVEIEGTCPMDQSPWFERAGRRCLVSWSDSEIGLEFFEGEEFQDSGSYPWEEAALRVQSWLGQA